MRALPVPLAPPGCLSISWIAASLAKNNLTWFLICICSQVFASYRKNNKMHLMHNGYVPEGNQASCRHLARANAGALLSPRVATMPGTSQALVRSTMQRAHATDHTDDTHTRIATFSSTALSSLCSSNKR